MDTTSNFFKEVQGAATLKHGILRRYLPVFAMRAGSRSPNNRVAYLDGYAGPGQYDDGQPGSPALAIETARWVLNTASGRAIDGYLVEKDAAIFAELKAFLEHAAPDWHAFQGDLQDHLPVILDSTDASTPLFAFVDPFGLGIPLKQIREIMQRGGTMAGGYRVGGVPTEILLNFSYPGLRRNAGHLTSTSTNEKYLQARATILKRTDRVLGGKWWREVWSSGQDDREAQIHLGWLHRVTEGSEGWGYWSIPVSDRWMGPPDYQLVLLTQHPAGLWHFNEALSSALEEFRQRCLEQAGSFDLDPLSVRERAWISEIKKNIQDLLRRRRHFTVGNEIFEVYGDAKGEAREKHIRRAIKQLYSEGQTSTNGVGDVQSMVVRRP